MLVLVIIGVVICLILLFRPNNAAAQALEHGPQGIEGCTSLFLWMIGAGLLMTVLVALFSGAMH